MGEEIKDTRPLINAHAHVFTGKFVPPFLAKTIVPWPLYYLIHTRWVVGFFRSYFQKKYAKEFIKVEDERERDILWAKRHRKNRMRRFWVRVRAVIYSKAYLRIPWKMVLLWLTLSALVYFLGILFSVFHLEGKIVETLGKVRDSLVNMHLVLNVGLGMKLLWIMAVLVFVKMSRQPFYFLLQLLVPVLKKVFSKRVLTLVERYYLLGRFSFYETQEKVAQRALHQLPPGSAMVILPMDMEQMGAGRSKIPEDKAFGQERDRYFDSYKYQMEELWEFVKNGSEDGPKERYHPFLFIDPRRIEKEGKSFFDWEIVNGKMVLSDCYVKTFIENRGFCGFKIYPALGYYPFDEFLIPLWRYASENHLPIMTHCIIGTIYYRGSIKKHWHFHPVFKEAYKKNGYGPKLLPESKNVDFQRNFTHPLNYLCLLEPQLLLEYLEQIDPKDRGRAREALHYDPESNTMGHDLSNLKLCMAHYGGEEEWIRYMEQDRQTYSQRISRDPDVGIRFMKNGNGELSWEKIDQIWENADWYSIISSMMMHYPHIYADLSYILSKPSIYPLLLHSLKKGENFEEENQACTEEVDALKSAVVFTGRNRMRSRILFGTDFYVVRNHKSDKNLFIDLQALLGQERFDLIARENPHRYLFNTLIRNV